MAGSTKLINDKEALVQLESCALFQGLDPEDIYKSMECAGAECAVFRKDEMIFTEDMEPRRLYVLVSGMVRVGRDSVDGKRSILVTYGRTGDIFGDVILFLGKKQYGFFAQAGEESKVVSIPRGFLSSTCPRGCGYHTRMVSNMLMILAQTAYSLNDRLEVLMCQTLRQKIGKMLLLYCEGDYSRKLVMTREEMAQTLNVARPSLSRELMKMVEDGLIRVEGRKISIEDVQALEELF